MAQVESGKLGHTVACPFPLWVEANSAGARVEELGGQVSRNVSPDVSLRARLASEGAEVSLLGPFLSLVTALVVE